jgi:hypothetical protein
MEEPAPSTVSPDVRSLIGRMSQTNPLWGARRIHGELLKLGIEVSQANVAKYLVRWATAVAFLADVLGQSRPDHGGGFLRRPDGGRSAAFRSGDARAPSAARRARRRNGTPDRRLDRPTTSRSLPVGRGGPTVDEAAHGCQLISAGLEVRNGAPSGSYCFTMLGRRSRSSRRPPASGIQLEAERHRSMHV